MYRANDELTANLHWLGCSCTTHTHTQTNTYEVCRVRASQEENAILGNDAIVIFCFFFLILVFILHADNGVVPYFSWNSLCLLLLTQFFGWVHGTKIMLGTSEQESEKNWSHKNIRWRQVFVADFFFNPFRCLGTLFKLWKCTKIIWKKIYVPWNIEVKRTKEK